MCKLHPRPGTEGCSAPLLPDRRSLYIQPPLANTVFISDWYSNHEPQTWMWRWDRSCNQEVEDTGFDALNYCYQGQVSCTTNRNTSAVQAFTSLMSFGLFVSAYKLILQMSRKQETFWRYKDVCHQDLILTQWRHSQIQPTFSSHQQLQGKFSTDANSNTTYICCLTYNVSG